MKLSIAQIWRYPIKSFGGEMLETTSLTADGIPYDRYWAIRDIDKGDILGGRNLGDLLKFSAIFCEEPTEKKQVAELTFPDGFKLLSDDRRLDNALSDALDRNVTLSSVRPASDTNYYERPQAFKFTPEFIRTAFELEEDEPLTDLSGKTEASSKYIRSWEKYRTRPGSHFDTSSIHILTEASLKYLQNIVPEVEVDVRRFRPNLLLSDSANSEDPIEFDWVDSNIDVGGAELNVTWETVRCVMTTREHNDLPRAAKLMRAMVRNTHQNLGVYAEVVRNGVVSVGDEIRVV